MGASTQAGARQGRLLLCFRVSKAPISIPLCCLQKGGREGEGDFFLVSPENREDFQTL